MRTGATDDDTATLVVRNGDVSAEHLRAISHEFHAHAVVARVSLIETPTVVLNAEGQSAFCRGKLNRDLGYAPMADGVRERFLRDAIEMSGGTVIERQRLLQGGIEVGSDPVTFHASNRHRLQAGNQTAAIRADWSESTRHGARRLDGAIHETDDVLDVGTRGRVFLPELDRKSVV